MIRRWIAVFALMAAPSVAEAAPTSGEIAAAQVAERRGAEMFAYDQAAWHATDRFQEDLGRKASGIDAARRQGLRGYIVEPGDGGGLLVTFYAERNGQRFAMARYTAVSGNITGGFVEPDGARELSLVAQRMIDAREKAMLEMAKPDHALCTQSPANTLVLPPRDDGTLPVYVLSSTVVVDSYPAGGHYRFDFDAQGKLVGERRFMKSCFNLDYAAKDGQRPQALVLTHLLDSQPTEIHAFVSRNVPFRLMVVTTANQAIWGIGNGHVQYLRDITDKN